MHSGEMSRARIGRGDKSVFGRYSEVLDSGHAGRLGLSHHPLQSVGPCGTFPSILRTVQRATRGRQRAMRRVPAATAARGNIPPPVPSLAPPPLDAR